MMFVSADATVLHKYARQVKPIHVKHYILVRTLQTKTYQPTPSPPNKQCSIRSFALL